MGRLLLPHLLSTYYLLPQYYERYLACSTAFKSVDEAIALIKQDPALLALASSEMQLFIIDLIIPSSGARTDAFIHHASPTTVAL